MNKKRNTVLVIGSGGREHAIVEALLRSDKVEKVYAAPGNPGMQAECVPIAADEATLLCEWAQVHQIDLTIVGPEVALEQGIVDIFSKAHLPVFGPSKAAAQIESSKDFAKQLMVEHGVPTAEYQTFSSYEPAIAYADAKGYPIVLKKDGLAAGKGVIIVQNHDEAEKALAQLMQSSNQADNKVVIEQFLEGEEFSLLAFVRHHEVYPMQAAKDHKRAFSGDKGPNTGGMGAYSPVEWVTEDDERFVEEHVLQPIANALCQNDTPFVGVLYAGLIKTSEGIKVIEFNARFGDPETEVLLPRLTADFYELCRAIAEGNQAEGEFALSVPRLTWTSDIMLGIVVAAQGYPGSYPKGLPLPHWSLEPQQSVFHMGTAMSTDGLEIVSNGGRVLMLAARGTSLSKVREEVLLQLENVNEEQYFYRNDIGLR